MKRATYENGEVVPLGFIDTANSLYFSTTPTAAFAADTSVRIQATAADAWIQIGPSVTAATAATAGNHFVPFGGAQDFNVEALDKIVATVAVCVTPFK